MTGIFAGDAKDIRGGAVRLAYGGAVHGTPERERRSGASVEVFGAVLSIVCRPRGGSFQFQLPRCF